MTTALAISVGVVIGAGFLYAVSRVGTVIEPYTLTTECDESWLEGDFPDAGAGTDDSACSTSVAAGHTESFDAFDARMTDRNYLSARVARDNFRAKQGEQQ
ncbi:hypothetical protein ACWGCW_00495 [Streptomyces sp. NPDC054933]